MYIYIVKGGQNLNKNQISDTFLVFLFFKVCILEFLIELVSSKFFVVSPSNSWSEQP